MLEIIDNCKFEAETKDIRLGDKIQFMSNVYFTPDYKYTNENNFVFDKIIGLRSSYR